MAVTGELCLLYWGQMIWWLTLTLSSVAPTHQWERSHQSVFSMSSSLYPIVLNGPWQTCWRDPFLTWSHPRSLPIAENERTRDCKLCDFWCSFIEASGCWLCTISLYMFTCLLPWRQKIVSREARGRARQGFPKPRKKGLSSQFFPIFTDHHVWQAPLSLSTSNLSS